MRLTDITLRSLPLPAKGQKTHWDDTLTGFGIRLSQGGTKSFVLQHGTERQLTTLGRFGIISLAEARQAAKEILAERTLGKHRPKTVPWDVAVEAFLAEVKAKKKPRTYADYKRLLTKHFNFGKKKLAETSYEDIERKLSKLKDVPSEQSHATTVVKIFLRWAHKPPRRYMPNNPTEGVTVTKHPSRKRVLSDKEIKIVWEAANEPVAFHQITRLCLLLGQRRTLTGAIQASYIDWDEQTINFPDTKANRPHTVPFGPIAAKILEILPKSGFLFPGRDSDDRPFNGWSKSKRELDAKYAGQVGHYTLHDLRRSASTSWAKLAPPHIVEAMLGHTFGSLQNQTDKGVSAVAEVYNLYLYLDEKRDLALKWETHLSQLLARH